MALGTDPRPVRSTPGSSERATTVMLNLLTTFVRALAANVDTGLTQTNVTLMDLTIKTLQTEAGNTITNP